MIIYIVQKLGVMRILQMVNYHYHNKNRVITPVIPIYAATGWNPTTPQ